MEATIQEVTRLCDEAGVSHELSLLNFVVSDGHTVVATRCADARTHAHIHTHTHTRTHARTHARTHTRMLTLTLTNVCPYVLSG